ncbi:phosphatidylinositol 3 4 5-trisphosphate 3-phosphatase [Tripterygium wilfordii]|uniref:Phosphatidylinositol 3 4 5-trisphosphate 3-phosphatase n=1 Tax=Tripterygium wilfordii TaxID=458696 RepID=A0A7J7CQ00_TRIWF|nr:phosphatidylinositol 3 4 5-trisphosphate 3-phosphatase [Tripterygium wilfordii]
MNSGSIDSSPQPVAQASDVEPPAPAVNGENCSAPESLSVSSASSKSSGAKKESTESPQILHKLASLNHSQKPEDYWIRASKKGTMIFAIPGEPGLTELVGDFKIHFHDQQGDLYCVRWEMSYVPVQYFLAEMTNIMKVNDTSLLQTIVTAFFMEEHKTPTLC